MSTTKPIRPHSGLIQAILVFLVAFCGSAYAEEAWDNTKCKTYTAYGGYKDTETGEGSGLLLGRSFNCFNNAVAGAGFETENLQVVVHSCLVETVCTAAGVKPGVAYVVVSKDGKEGDFRRRGEVIVADNKRTKVRELNSPIVYSWVDGQELIEPNGFSLISNQH